MPTLNDGWLSGFTDAEGSFNINITGRPATCEATGFRVQLRYLLDQKNAKLFLFYIRNLFSHGKVSLRGETKEVYRYTCNTFIGAHSVCNYFHSFPLKTIKATSFANWFKVYTMVINKEHLTEEGLDKIRKIKKKVNVINIEANKIGNAKP